MTSLKDIIIDVAMARKLNRRQAEDLARGVKSQILERLLAGDYLTLPGMRIEAMVSAPSNRHNLLTGAIEPVKSQRRLRLVVSMRFKQKFKQSADVVTYNHPKKRIRNKHAEK